MLEKILAIYPSLGAEDFEPGGTIRLQDDGSGPYIAAWGHPDLPAPTEQELDSVGHKAKQNLLMAEVTVKRWAVMTGGLTLPSGVAVGTSIDDQNRITSVVANAALAGLTDADEVDFKAASGWVRITIGQVKEIAGVIGQFVQACYSAERQHHEAIALLDPGDFDTYDLEAHWPPTDLTAQS